MVYAGAFEECDGIDNNCNILIDEICDTVQCSPNAPWINCGAEERCFPNDAGGTYCTHSSIGAGFQGGSCNDMFDCQAEFVCATINGIQSCAQWCTVDSECPLGMQCLGTVMTGPYGFCY